LAADRWAPRAAPGGPTLESFLQDGSKIGTTSSVAVVTFDWSKASLHLRVTAHRAWDSARFWSSVDLKEEPWLQPTAFWDSFPAYPGARKLCSQHVTGSSGGERREIDWSSYAAKDRDDAFSFYSGYANWHGLKSDLVNGRLVLVSRDGNGRLTLHEAADSYPGCGIRPGADENGVVIVSRRSPS
jgi:hypothetical protein